MDYSNTILVIKGVSQYEVLRVAADAVCEGFKKKGYQVKMIDCKELGNYDEDTQIQLTNNLANEMRNPYACIFSVQAVASEVCNNIGVSILEECNCPYIGWIFEHPDYHLFRLEKINCETAHIAVVDKKFEKYMEQYIPNVKNKFFLPHGGFVGEKEPSGYEDKDIEIFCPGTCGKMIEIEQYVEVYLETVKTVYNAVFQMAENNPDMQIYECLELYMDNLGEKLDKEGFEELKFIMALVDANIRYKCKYESVKTLLKYGYKVHVAGKNWDKLALEYPENLVWIKEDMDIQEVVEYMHKSKIVLNLAPTLSGGLHERVLTALMAKAAVITPYNSYIAEELKTCESLYFFQMKHMERLPELVGEILQFQNMEQRTSKARKYILEKHTWEKRGEEIIDYMEKLKRL